MRLPLGTTDQSRTVAGEPDIPVLNRYFESDPTNQEDQVALISRPGLSKWLTVGAGPIRNVYSQPGAFNEVLFVVSGNTVYTVAPDETVTSIGTLGTSTGYVSITATDTYAFFADGAALYSYTINDYAHGTLTASGTVSAGETVTIGSITYEFATDVSPGTADGSAGNPWLVYLGASTAEALQHLYNAILDTGTAGTDYSAAIAPNPDASAVSVDSTTLEVRAAEPGTGGNSITTTETMANASWGAAALSGGGDSSFGAVTVPDGDGIISVGTIAQYVICVVAQGQNRNGRFYWIEPGEVTIDPLNFATAERSPDPAWNVVVLGDQFWLPGSSTVEVWYPNGDPLAPFLRQQGRLFERGAWNGTVCPIGETMMVIDSDGIVFAVSDAPRVVSAPGVTERIRKAINAQRAA